MKKCCVEGCNTMGEPEETYGFNLFICTPCLLKLSAPCETEMLQYLLQSEPVGGIQ